MLQERRRRELPSPTEVCPERKELIEEIDLDEPDTWAYDRHCDYQQDQKKPEKDQEKQDE